MHLALMKRTEKHDYLTPTVKAVAFRIERGFEASPIESADSDDGGIEEMQEYTGENANMDGTYF